MPHFTRTYEPHEAPALPEPGAASIAMVLAYLSELHQDIAALTEMVISIEQVVVGSPAVATPPVEAPALPEPDPEPAAVAVEAPVEAPIEPPVEAPAPSVESDEPELF